MMETIQQTERWVVVFLAVDGPTALGRDKESPALFATEKEAQDWAKAIYEGRDSQHYYLKGSYRLTVWTYDAFVHRGESGKVVLPTGQLDGLNTANFDPQEYM